MRQILVYALPSPQLRLVQYAALIRPHSNLIRIKSHPEARLALILVVITIFALAVVIKKLTKQGLHLAYPIA